jgi:F420H(2)-dependent quinone reductase
MPAVRRTTLVEIIWKLHRYVYRASGGRVGGAIGGTPVLLLITTSRRSGQPRPVTLTYFEDGDRLVVISSNAGEDRHPAWWLNLKEHPDATVQIGDATTQVLAAEPSEKNGRGYGPSLFDATRPTRNTDCALSGGYPSSCCSLLSSTIQGGENHRRYRPYRPRPPSPRRSLLSRGFLRRRNTGGV